MSANTLAVANTTATPNGTIIHAGNTATITDATGGVWGINSSGIVTFNGVPDLATFGVAAIGISNGNIYQINTANACFEKVISPWTQVTTSPMLRANVTVTYYFG